MLYSMSMILTTTRGSDVYDDEWAKEFKDSCSQLDYKHYCDKIGDCEAGSHLFCIFYKPGKIMGPRCPEGAQMVRLSQDHKDYIMGRVNSIRAEVAKGDAKGQNDVPLPRGYGIAKIVWDSELATLAQLWANQCKLDYGRHCMATKQFSRPWQIQSLYRYTYPDWQIVDERTGLKDASTLKECVTQQKVDNALKIGLNSLIRSKQRADKTEVETHGLGFSYDNQYLLLINGASTHIGCAMSSYRIYHWKNEWKNYDFHGIHLVCYLSAIPDPDEPLYPLENPRLKGVNATEKCGCLVPDYEEDDDCLCVLASKTSTTTEATTSDDTDATTTEATTSDDTDATTIATTTSEATTSDDTDATTTEATTASNSTNKSDEPESQTTSKSDTTAASTASGESTIKSSSRAPDESTIKSSSTAPESTTRENDDVPGDDVSGNDNGKQNCSGNSHQKQRVVVMPIFAFEDAPPEETLYPWSNSTSKAKSRQYNWRDFEEYPIETATPKKSIFSGLATFGLQHERNDSILVNKDLKNILHNVPRKDRSRLEELFLKFILEQNHLRRTNENQLFRPVENYHVSNQADVPNNYRNIDEHNFEDVNHKNYDIVFENPEVKVQYDTNFWLQQSRRTGNFIENTETGGNNKKEEIESQIVVPIIRKQKPLVGGKESVKYFQNNNNEKIFKKGGTQKNFNYNVARNNIRSFNDKITLVKDGKNTGANKISKNVEASNFNNRNSVPVDDLKLKRRAYLNNEISKLKNKLKHFRHLRKNDVNKKERMRPLVPSRSERKNTKLEDVNTFYMPDRAHPLHDF